MEKINVTKTFLPPIEEYQTQLQRIWEDKWLTNNGTLFKELTKKLEAFLDVKYLIPMTNGTLPLQIALNAYGKQGEIITTPFSYVATTASIIWEKCSPVFVDIDPNYLTIDESKIEEAITHRTTAILATHVYGTPCNVEVIADLARKYNLKVIYDGAHCFGVKYKGRSIFQYGDLSTCSFHATKLFHTGEGGALFCPNMLVYEDMWCRHNFGHSGYNTYSGLGINAKMSELQAAMGLSILPHLPHIVSERKKVCDYYDENLSFKKFKKPGVRQFTEPNYIYYPIIFSSEELLLQTKKKLEDNQIFSRRYFYPNLEKLPYIDSSKCPNAEQISRSILCLPLSTYLVENELNLIVKIINQCAS